MIRKKLFKQVTSIVVSTAMLVTLVLPNVNVDMFGGSVSADNLPITTLGAGSIGVGSNEAVASKLPRANTQGVYRYTTDNYDNNHEALDTNDWASNWLWSLDGSMETYEKTDSNGVTTIVDVDALSGTAFALPLSFLMKRDGLRITKPPMISAKGSIVAYNTYDDDTLADFKFYPDWECDISNVDEISDWSQQAIATDASRSKEFKVTMTQGVPFGFMELENSNVLYIEKLRVTFPSDIIYQNTYDGAKMLVFRAQDNTSPINGYPGLTYQYYAMYLPEGTTTTYIGTSDTTKNDRIGKWKFEFPSGKEYASFAWICESQNMIDSQAISYAQEYRPYAFNIITDTRADYSYNEDTATVSTTYKYSFDKKSESKVDGTIMGILPHQYKNMNGYSYMGNTATTIRGVMKFMKGSSYTTNMTYKGIIPYMPSLPESDTAGRAELQKYVDEFISTYMPGSGSWTLAKDEGNETYYHGKKLNRSAQVVAAAKSLGDEESADKVLNGLKANLEEWFTYSGTNDKNYFTYLGEGIGVLLGYPTSFNAVDQFNDHHFHYGYFIQAAACVGLWDKDWLNNYKDVVKQLVYDIASPYRNQDDCVSDCGNAYPYLRSFAPYEGHSWASGYEDPTNGNNQESTSEAINAWAGIILFGELIGDEEIRDMGIYLYTTEIAAADNYWFDIDEDIYKIQNSKYEPPMASMVWGGKVDFATWFGAQYTQGIQICPMQSWSFYYLNGGQTMSGEDYIKKVYDYDKNGSLSQGGSVNLWNDMWASYYALADPETAMNSIWTRENINDGESQAHTYHYIQSLIDYGTPDLSFTSNDPMTSVFEKNGKYTYAVYNSSNATKTVTFKDASGKAVNVKAEPNGMTLFNSDDIGKPSYTVEYYGKDLSGNGYSLIGSSVKYATAGTNVTAEAKEFTGFTYDSSNSSNVMTGNVTNDSSLVLKVYYQRETYSVSYDLAGGQKSDTSKYPASYIYGQTYELDTPVKDGYDFYGWYADAEYSVRVKSITTKHHENLTLYAKWIPQGTILINEDTYLTFDPSTNGTFTIYGDSVYDSVSVLYKISDTESDAKKLADDKEEVGFVSWPLSRTASGWTRTENFAGSSGKYITFYFIRYDSAGSYKTDYGYGRIGAGSVEIPTDEIETTTAAVGDDVAPGEVTNWTPVLNNANVSYYIVGDTSKITTKPEQHEDGIYIAYSLPAAFSSVTLNGTSKTPTDGAFYTLSLDDVASTGYYTLIVTDFYGKDSVKIYFKVGTPSSEAGTTLPVETTTTAAPTEDLQPSEVTNWTKVLNSSDVYYYICGGKEGKVTVTPQKRVDDIYMAYALAGPFNKVTLNGVAKEPRAGADYAMLLSDIAEPGYYTLEVVDFYGQESVTIIFKVATEDETVEVVTTAKPAETTTKPVDPEVSPLEVIGENSNADTPGRIFVIWGQDQERIDLGQKYNVYLDGEIAVDVDGNRLENVMCVGVYIPASEGVHTIKITAVLNGKETAGATNTLTVTAPDDTITISEDLNVNGNQINTVFGGIRTVYSAEPVINDKAVEEVGLIYSMKGYAGVEDMYYGSPEYYVKSFKAQIGKTDVNYSDSETADNYIMTMRFVGNSAFEFNIEWMVRVYARLSDGSYVYSDVYTYSIFEVADYLYSTGKMTTQESHDYLYNNILLSVNKDYKKIEFDPNNAVGDSE